MGKTLTIHGADFSVNGISIGSKRWYITNGTDYLDKYIGTPSVNSTSGSWAFNETQNALLQGKTINLIRLVPADAGDFYLYVLDSYSQTIGSPAAIISVASGDVGKLTEYKINDINVGNSQVLAFVNPSQTVRFYYAGNVATVPFYKRVGFSNYSLVENFVLLFDVGYDSASTAQ